MSGSTTRLGLYLAGGGSSEAYVDEVIDIDKQNGNFEDIDDVIGYLICTSATRPATPFTGQPIYETDTKNRMLRVSGAWVPVGTPNAASSVLRDALYPAPVSGDRVYRTDLLSTQTYNGTAWLTTAFRPRSLAVIPNDQVLTTTAQVITYTTAEVADPDMHSSSVNPSRLIAPEAGLYRLDFQLYVNSGTLISRVEGFKNGVAINNTRNYQQGHSGAGPRLIGYWITQLAAADYFEIKCSMDSGSASLVSVESHASLLRIG